MSWFDGNIPLNPLTPIADFFPRRYNVGKYVPFFLFARWWSSEKPGELRGVVQEQRLVSPDRRRPNLLLQPKTAFLLAKKMHKFAISADIC